MDGGDPVRSENNFRLAMVVFTPREARCSLKAFSWFLRSSLVAAAITRSRRSLRASREHF